MKVIIAGSRDIIDFAVHYVIRAIERSKFNITEVVSGGARGIDWCGEKWAEANDVPIKRFLPQWNDHGRQAGILRNIQMAEYADALIAIWDGQSRGTRHMIHEAKKRRMPYHVFIVKQGKPAFTIDELSVLRDGFDQCERLDISDEATPA